MHSLFGKRLMFHLFRIDLKKKPLVVKLTIDLRTRPKAEFLFSFYRETGPIAWVSLGLQMLLGMIRGVGLLMIIPMLYVSGVIEGNAGQGIFFEITVWLGNRGISLGLSGVLISFVLGISFFAWLKRLSGLLDTGIWQKYVKNLQSEVYRALTHANWLHLLGTKSSDSIYTLTNDLAKVSSGIRQSLTCLSIIVIAIVNFVVALFISWKIALLVLVSGAVLWLVLRPLNRQSLHRGKTQRGLQLSFFAEVTQNLSAIKLIKSSGEEKRSLSQFNEVVERMHDDMMLFQRSKANAQFLYAITAASCLSFFIYFALKWGELNPAALLMMIYLFVRLIPLLSRFQQSWQLVLNAQPSFDAYRQLIRELKAEEEEGTDQSFEFSLEKSITGESVSFSYLSDRKNVLQRLNFVIPAKKMTALVGDSGRGKTTLLDIIIGLLAPANGSSVRVDDTLLDQNLCHAWRKRIAYVPQETFLFPDTIRANLSWANPAVSEDEMLEALDWFAGDFVRCLPLGLDTVVGERGKLLSGGECQRIALARAVLGRPLLLVLDEATNALDSESEAVVMRSLRRISEHTTIFFATHKEALWKQADHMIKL